MTVSIKRIPGPNQKTIDVLIKGMDKLKGQVGFFESARYEDGTPVAYVATIQEFGSPTNNIPPRSFMRAAVHHHRQEWDGYLAAGSRSILNGNTRPLQLMKSFVDDVATQVQGEIADIQEPPLKPATVAARLRRRADKTTVGGLTKPLIDTGFMKDSVEGRVL